MRVGALCEHKDKGCPWRIWASWDKNKTKFCVKSYVGEHTCGRSSEVKKMSASWIAKQYNTQFKVNPYMRYAAEILRSNRRNTVKLKLNGTVFDRIYICFEALRKGFLGGSRPFISLDGCFLKEEGAGYTFMSDQRKGFLAAIVEVFPQAESRILKWRHKPIISMLEDIRESLMDRLHKKRDMIKERDLSLCPRIQQQLEKHKIWARGWNAFWDGGFCCGVKKGATQTKYIVNLSDRTCSCNAWQVSGIPCQHAVVAI
ncbi:uncharacterized protein LOC110686810 [Chenopodium quinoa]|uniref:uncharacterized protein LOC110686810 n=1 Tax=Chenopodium quinoa TaxID=63459 RepID=UPI000B77B5BD|nr:uncharacterized protein LOC110686810 [Chenopodium quinoa]